MDVAKLISDFGFPVVASNNQEDIYEDEWIRM